MIFNIERNESLSYNDKETNVMNSKKALISLMLITTLVAQNKGARPKTTAEPKPIVPFQLSYEDIPMIEKLDLRGSVLIQFTIDEHGKVIKPEIVDSFTSMLDNVVIEKVMSLKFEPALQNGVPVQVRYSLPILFK